LKAEALYLKEAGSGIDKNLAASTCASGSTACGSGSSTKNLNSCKFFN